MNAELNQEIQGVATGARQSKFDPGHLWSVKPRYL